MSSNRKRRKMLLLKAGQATASVRLTHGDYDRWFMRALAAAPVDWHVVEVHARQQLPTTVKHYDALAITGSPLSLAEPEQWMQRAAEYVREVVEQGRPVLGVCFGHQLLGFAYGSKVVRNSHGREMGSVEIELTEAGQSDPLFGGLPEKMTVQATHEDVVESPPPGSVVLAKNANTLIQAMAIGNRARGVQFHPELEPDALAALTRSRADVLEREAELRGAPRNEAVRLILSGIRPAPLAQKVLLNFVERFI